VDLYIHSPICLHRGTILPFITFTTIYFLHLNSTMYCRRSEEEKPNPRRVKSRCHSPYAVCVSICTDVSQVTSFLHPLRPNLSKHYASPPTKIHPAVYVTYNGKMFPYNELRMILNKRVIVYLRYQVHPSNDLEGLRISISVSTTCRT
jgi:hypothetical protein